MVNEVRPSSWRRPSTVHALFLLTFIGAMLAGLPHEIAWATTGDPPYLADGDGLHYLG